MSESLHTNEPHAPSSNSAPLAVRSSISEPQSQATSTLAPEEASPPSPWAPPTIGQDIRAGLLGLAIAVGCLFLIIPVVHFFAALSGPGVGGFFASARIKARGRHTFFVGLTIGIGECIAVGIIATVMMMIGVITPDTTTKLFMAGAMVLALFYATGLGTVGAYFGGRGD